jgi:hypothetical protein
MGTQRETPQLFCDATPSKRQRAWDADFRIAKFTCLKTDVLLARFQHHPWSQLTMVQQTKKWYHSPRGHYEPIPDSEIEPETQQHDPEAPRPRPSFSRKTAMLVLYSTLVLYLSLTMYFGRQVESAHPENTTYKDHNSQNVNVL